MIPRRQDDRQEARAACTQALAPAAARHGNVLDGGGDGARVSFSLSSFSVAAAVTRSLSVPLTWSIESLQPHQRDLLQVHTLHR